MKWPDTDSAAPQPAPYQDETDAMPDQHENIAIRSLTRRVPDRRYRQYAPCPQLAPYVLCYWSMRTDADISDSTRVRVVPDGCVDVVFDPGGVLTPVFNQEADPAGPPSEVPCHQGDATDYFALTIPKVPSRHTDQTGQTYQVGQHDQTGHDRPPVRAPRPASSPAVFLTGIMRQSMIIGYTAPGTSFGIRFRPAGAGVFLRLPVHETTELRLSLHDVLPDLAARLEDALLLSPANMSPIVTHLEQALLHRLTAIKEADPLAHAAVSLFAADRGTRDIAATAAHLGTSTRQLERSFAHHVGLSPKQFCRILRLHKVLHLLRNNPASVRWSSVAAECGFADQSHLVREMQSLFGLTPSALQREHEHVAFIQYTMPDLR
ncbi:helix-turn-helix domain-containing protein [Desulfovibrio subterraneus]|nr:helix-turn-helix domain-containing protein [Desulfovibrio subterraneus]